MLKITNKAVRILKATARSKEGASDDAGIRIRRDAVSPKMELLVSVSTSAMAPNQATQS